jgi:LPXTG-motif cell wall-anchored protein
MLKMLASACVCAVLAFTSTTAHAQTVDNRTFFTFSQPVTLPGVTLPAGKYLFRNPDITTSRRVVQVLSDDGKQSYAMLLTIPAQRTQPSSEPEIRFMETAEGTPPAIRAWWYPGNTIGWEFIYPKEQALKLAKAASGSVLTTASAQNDTTEEMKTADLARVTGSGGETAVAVDDKPSETAVAGTAQQGQIAASTIQIPTTPTPVTPAADATSASGDAKQASAATSGTTRTRLPQTASSRPALALLGVGMLAVGALLFRWPSPRV